MTNLETDQFGNQRWFNNAGQYHRTDGPAFIFVINGYVEWVINGYTYYDNKEFQKAANLSDEDMTAIVLKYGNVS
jgi:hypothetical protein